LFPGGATAVVLGLLAVVLGSVLAWAPSALLVALLLGALVATLFPGGMRPLHLGANAIAGPLLRAGIILLGARGNLELVAAVGPVAAVVVIFTMTAVLAFVTVAARRARIAPALAVLIAVGTAVCGNSAVAAAAPLVRARHAEIALAIGTVTLFGTGAMITYPVIGRLLGLDDLTFGVWAGAGIHDTSQVVATAFVFSPAAGEVATIVKLGRNALMLPILLALAMLWRGEVSHLAAARTSLLLVGGYVGLVVVNTLGLIPPDLAELAARASTTFLAIAMAAVGLGLQLRELRRLGGSAIAIGFGASALGGCIALALALALHGVAAP
jgi:uncharacterized integral membrane protein (TIGR00698 family)